MHVSVIFEAGKHALEIWKIMNPTIICSIELVEEAYQPQRSVPLAATYDNKKRVIRKTSQLNIPFKMVNSFIEK